MFLKHTLETIIIFILAQNLKNGYKIYFHKKTVSYFLLFLIHFFNLSTSTMFVWYKKESIHGHTEIEAGIVNKPVTTLLY